MKKNGNGKPWKSKEELVRMVDDVRKSQGLTIADACKQVGANYTYYYAIKREMGAREGEGKRVSAVSEPKGQYGVRDLSFEEFVRLKREYEQLKGH